MQDTFLRLMEDERLRGHSLARELIPVLLSPTGRTAGGYPYLERPAYERLRDWVPYLLANGEQVLRMVGRIREVASEQGHGPSPFEESSRVVGQVVRTAAITAPSDLWLLNYVLSAFERKGWLEQLRAGQWLDIQEMGVAPSEVVIDLDFLLSRGFLFKGEGRFRAAQHPTSQHVWQGFQGESEGSLLDKPAIWAEVFSGKTVSQEALDGLMGVLRSPVEAEAHRPPAWVPTLWDIHWGGALLNLVLGLRASGKTRVILDSERFDIGASLVHCSELVPVVEAICAAAGVCTTDGGLTEIGRRVFGRGPGPMGIVAAYLPYMTQLEEIWREGRQAIHVQRGANIAASQDANRKTFLAANDALDRFCAETGFQPSVFIEHALGKGEATRQRYERSADALRYVGADLEWAAIEAARAERDAGRLPADMVLVGGMDIGAPERLFEAIREAGCTVHGSVMVVGNGFHEVREQTDAKLEAVFSAYEQAGVILLFTEESALLTADLLETAWNTYHAGFRYVHERSGQGLRPARPEPPSIFGEPRRASWTECAERAGYVRADRYCSKGRTIYPFTPIHGHNPAISVNHFFVPGGIAEGLKF